MVGKINVTVCKIDGQICVSTNGKGVTLRSVHAVAK